MELDNFGYLLGETARVLTRRFDEYAQANGITHAQWMVLIALMRQEGISQAQLAKYLEVEPISMSRMIDRLQAGDLIHRVEDPGDRRIKTLYLTPNAKKVLKRLRSYGAEVLAEASAGISDAEIQRFVVTVSRMRSNLLKAAQTPVKMSVKAAAKTR